MSEVKSTTIVPISFYCFVLAIYFISLAGNAIWGDKKGLSSTDLSLWLTVIAFIILTVGIIVVGIGILYLKKLYWKILFFSLAVSVSSIASFVLIFLVFLLTNLKILAPYYQVIQNAAGGWIAFLSFFLSEIIILYYLASNDVVSCFGEMGPLISPF